jgi:N-acetylglucosamine malate deacetylase 1
MIGRRILILVPHPDDEVVGAAGAILRARASGADVTALDLTHGVPPREHMWPRARGAAYDRRVARRRREAAAAARRLDIARIADTGRPARTLIGALAETLARVRAALDATGADTLWTPAYEGGNADHDGANAVAAVVSRQRPALRVFEFAEYSFAGGRTRSQEFIAGRGGEIVLELSPEEREVKRRALADYASERGNLFYVRTAREAFRPLPAHDYAAAPHAGTLFHERFHWVPFRHPRIDFTTGTAVRAAIAAFLAAEGGGAPGRR